MTTKKSFSGGVETVKEFENDVLVSHTVNGTPQPIRGAIGGGAHAANAAAASPYHRSSGGGGGRRTAH
jgi:hypothetical protein